jgi:RNA polymerase sigma factor (sigma-70 family)
MHLQERGTISDPIFDKRESNIEQTIVNKELRISCDTLLFKIYDIVVQLSNQRIEIPIIKKIVEHADLQLSKKEIDKKLFISRSSNLVCEAENTEFLEKRVTIFRATQIVDQIGSLIGDDVRNFRRLFMESYSPPKDYNETNIRDATPRINELLTLVYEVKKIYARVIAENYKFVGSFLNKKYIRNWETDAYSPISRHNILAPAEMYNICCLGLLQAFKEYDPMNKAQFSTYAFYYLFRAMKDASRKTGTAVILSPNFDRDYRSYLKDPDLYEASLLDDKESSRKRKKTPIKVLKEYKDSLSLVVKYDGITPQDGEGDFLSSYLPPESARGIVDLGPINKAITQLSDSDQLLYKRIFVEGLDGKAVGLIMNVSKQRIHVKKKNLLKSIKEALVQQGFTIKDFSID